MTTINVSLYSSSGTEATLICSEEHGLSVGNYFSVRNVNSNINGQYFVKTIPNQFSITYDIDSPFTISENNTDGFIIITSFNQSGKPAFVYDESADTWYQISGKVNTNGNYTWTGTHLFQAPVTMEDLLILSNLSASVSASPVGGGFIYVEGGALKFKGGNGTITTVAPA
jgi:hypothetical protein